MRLIFYSGGSKEDNYKLDEELFSTLNSKKLTFVYIPSCSYTSDEDYQDFKKQYNKWGVKNIIKFNVDKPFSSVMLEKVFESDMIHLGGGNTYYFLEVLKEKKLLKRLRDWVDCGGTLSGLSAGSIIMTPNIATAGIPSFDKDENDSSLKNFTSMGLVDFEFFPHYKNSKRYDKELLQYSLKNKRALYACPDGSGIFVKNGVISFFGKTYCFLNGTKMILNK